MFDYIFCDYTLPLPEEAKQLKTDFSKGVKAPIDWSKFEFQTKNFDGLLDKYTIEEDGQIYVEKMNRELVEHENGEIEMIEKDTGIEKVEYTGEIVFYNMHLDEKDDYWIEFKTLFWKGDLKEIELLNWEKKDNTERKEHVEIFSKKMKKAIKNQDTLSYKFKMKYNLIVRFIFGYFVKICWFMQKIFTFKK